MSAATATVTHATQTTKHQHSPRRRSSTDPKIKRPQIYHTASFSIDGAASPHTSGTERDTLSSTSSLSGEKITKLSINTLRRKQKREDIVTVKSPTISIFHTTPLPIAPLVRTLSSTSTTDGRSPNPRRAPASHSSYGIGTTCGPPPSFSTQQTLSQDRLWKPTASDKADGLDAVPSRIPRAVHSVDEVVDLPTPPVGSSIPGMSTETNEDPQDNSQPALLEKGISDSHVATEETIIAEDMSPSTAEQSPTTDEQSPTTDEQGKESSTESHKSEDLFLNIAKDSEEQQTSRNDKRRSRISLPFLSNPRNEQGNPSEQARRDTTLLFPRSEIPRKPRLSLVYQSSAASAHPLDDTSRQRYFSAAARPTSTLPRSISSREGPNKVATGIDPAERPKYLPHNTTESTVSTTAPSTVWDELDDLKSRIKKLELTGKLPSSSAAAMSNANGERPRTATTNATTMSASPKHAKGISPTTSAIEGVSSSVHPLLHEALSKAKPALSHEVYQRLESIASDALQLAAMMTGSSQAQNNNQDAMISTTERQIRRKADSMCRGLTELAIALSTDRPQTLSIRPPSRDTISSHYSPRVSVFAARRLSNDAEERALPAPRVQSRLDTRRGSHLYTSNNSRMIYSSPDTATNPTPTALPQMPPTSSSRLSRPSSSLRNRRAYGLLDGGADDDDHSPTFRPASRAMTDIGRSVTQRYSPRGQVNASREYISQEPMPTAFENPSDAHQSSLAPPFASGLVSRRVSGSPASVVGNRPSAGPVTPRDNVSRRLGPGRESSLPLSSAENTPENVTIERGSGSRKNFGLASRIGTSVGSRLRAARSEKFSKVNEQARPQQQLSYKELSELQQESERARWQVEQENAPHAEG